MSWSDLAVVLIPLAASACGAIGVKTIDAWMAQKSTHTASEDAIREDLWNQLMECRKSHQRVEAERDVWKDRAYRGRFPRCPGCGRTWTVDWDATSERQEASG